MNDFVVYDNYKTVVLFYSSWSYYACFLNHSKNNANVPNPHTPLHEFINIPEANRRIEHYEKQSFTRFVRTP